MDTPELVEKASKYIFSTGLSDASSSMCRKNMAYGLANIHYVQEHFSLEPNAIFVSSPDETITRNKTRWASGIGYGGKISWGNGKEKVVILDTKPNACGMLVGGIDEVPTPYELSDRIHSLRETVASIDGIGIDWDFSEGNHFIDIFRVKQITNVKLPSHVFIIHASAPELKGDNPKGFGLYYDKSPILEELLVEVETPFNTYHVLLDSDARDYLKFYKYAEEFSKKRRLLCAKELFGSFKEITNPNHQGLLNYNEIILGTQYVGDATPNELYPVALRADLPAYLVHGNKSFSEEKIEMLGFTKRSEKLGVYDKLRNANILPHGAGYSFPEMLAITNVFQLDGTRYFEIDMRNDYGKKIISHVGNMAYGYRGKDVILKTLELGLCTIAAKLIPEYVLKI